MNNSKVYPFERNHYFYGKLLSVEDFETEQKYVNDKRRFLNQFLFGSGVVCGLNVVDVDEQSVSVEAGFAIDSWGREIVIDEPLLIKLSGIEGYAASVDAHADVVYLCLEYDESGEAAVHSFGVAKGGPGAGVRTEYDRIAEGFRLYLTAKEPEEEYRAQLSSRRFVETQEVLYDGEHERITQIVPRFAKKGEMTEFFVRIENRGRNTLAFSYDIRLGGFLTEEGKSSVRVTFDEALYEKNGEYVLRIPIMAAKGTAAEGTLRVEKDSVKLSLSGEPENAEFDSVQTVMFAEEGISRAIRDYYYSMSMKRAARQDINVPVYLARMSVITTEDTIIIEKTENVPFGQRVLNLPLVESLMESERMNFHNTGGEGTHPQIAGLTADHERMKISQGVYELHVRGGRKGDRSYSPEIVHGLGLGRVAIILGREEADGGVVYGGTDVFERQEKDAIEVALAAKVNEAEGSFVIGAKLLSQAVDGRIRIHWTAVRDEKGLYEKNDKRLFIKPNMLELGVRESYALECVTENMVEKQVSWSVKENGGFIDENGYYTAPNVPGVYEVIARSTAYPEVRASIFVVVREL